MINFFFFHSFADNLDLHSFPTRRSSDLSSVARRRAETASAPSIARRRFSPASFERSLSLHPRRASSAKRRSEEHTSELQSRRDLVCRLLLEKKKIYAF